MFFSLVYDTHISLGRIVTDCTGLVNQIRKDIVGLNPTPGSNITDMKTIELKGILECKYSEDWRTVKLVQEDGYKIDLIGRFKEIQESFPKKKVQISYYLSDTISTKDEMIEGFLKKLYGGITSSYEREEWAYSEYTQGVDYTTNLFIGNHDLFSELYGEEGKFILFQINIDAGMAK